MKDDSIEIQKDLVPSGIKEAQAISGVDRLGKTLALVGDSSLLVVNDSGDVLYHERHLRIRGVKWSKQFEKIYLILNETKPINPKGVNPSRTELDQEEADPDGTNDSSGAQMTLLVSLELPNQLFRFELASKESLFSDVLPLNEPNDYLVLSEQNEVIKPRKNPRKKSTQKKEKKSQNAKMEIEEDSNEGALLEAEQNEEEFEGNLEDEFSELVRINHQLTHINKTKK